MRISANDTFGEEKLFGGEWNSKSISSVGLDRRVSMEIGHGILF